LITVHRNACSRLVLAACASLVLALPAPADASSSPWTVTATSSDRAPGVVRAQVVAVNRTALAGFTAGATVALPLFDDRSIAATVDRRRVTGPGRHVLAGSIANDATGWFLLAVNGDGLAGFIRAGALGYRIRGAADGSMTLEAIDDRALPWCDVERAGGLEPAPGGGVGAGGGAAAGACDDGSVIDLLVLYSRQARDAAGGTANIVAEIDLLVAYMNESFDNTLVVPDMHTVHIRELATHEDSISLGNLTGRADGVVDGVHLLRDLYGADQVALVESGGGGVANGLFNLEPESEARMFCINGRNTVPFIIAHEVGHNLGACHARGDGGGCPDEGGLLFPYSNGYRFVGQSLELWRTVMAYQPGVTSPLYSNPLVDYDGVPTGRPEGQPDSADNVKTINLAAFAVSNWRCTEILCEDLALPSDADDCNGNDVPDLCEIVKGEVDDSNGDGIPDECQCVGDVDGSGSVTFDDLVLLLASWGPCDPCAEDLDGDGVVAFPDLLLLLAHWGPCP
jgi:hypothetical protein